MKRQTTFLLVISILFLMLGRAAAQEAVSLEMLRVALWPEYDDPRLLVIVDGVLPEAGQTVRFPVPADAQINAVATSSADGSLLNAEWKIAGQEGDFQIISLLSDGDRFRIEYYADMAASDDQREADFRLPAGYIQAKQAVIEALLPPGTEDVSGDPPLQSADAAAGDAALYVREAGVLDANSSLAQTVSYRNPAGALTNPPVAQPPPAPAPAQPDPGAPPVNASSPNYLVWGLGALAVLLIGGGLALLWWSGREEEIEVAVAGGRPTKRGKIKGGEPVGKDRYCRQCGAKFAAEDRYCRQCGARRR